MQYTLGEKASWVNVSEIESDDIYVRNALCSLM